MSRNTAGHRAERVRARSVRRFLVVALVMSLTAAACDGGNDPADPQLGTGTTTPSRPADSADTAAPSDRPVESPPTSVTGSPDVSSPTVPPDAAPSVAEFDGTDEFVRVLAEAGVTVRDPSTGEALAEVSEPVGPIEITAWQAQSLAREATLGAGLMRDSIDQLAPDAMPDVPMSAILAGYVIAADTPGGRWASDVMGPLRLADADTAVFPAAVLLLFAAESARASDADVVADGDGAGDGGEGAAESGDGSSGPVGLALPAGSATPAAANHAAARAISCPLFGAQVDFMLDQFFRDAVLHSNAWLPNWASAGGYPPEIVLLPLWTSFAPSIGLGITALLTVSLIAGVVGSWTFAVTPSSPTDRFAVGSEADRPQQFTATVSGGLVWPPGLEECAWLQGLQLPEPTGANSAVTWIVDGLPAYGTETGRDDAFDDSGSAEFRWVTGREASDTGFVRTGTVTAAIRPDPVFRGVLAEIASQAFQTVLSQAGTVDLSFDINAWPDLFAIIDAAELFGQGGFSEVVVTYHAEGCRTGRWRSVDYRAQDQSTIVGSGTMEIVFSDENNGSASFDPDVRVLARLNDPSAPWVRMAFHGAYTFRSNDDGTQNMIIDGDGEVLADAFLGGWIPLEPFGLFEGGGAFDGGSVFVCNGDTLTLTAGPALWEFTRVSS